MCAGNTWSSLDGHLGKSTARLVREGSAGARTRRGSVVLDAGSLEKCLSGKMIRPRPRVKEIMHPLTSVREKVRGRNVIEPGTQLTKPSFFPFLCLPREQSLCWPQEACFSVETPTQARQCSFCLLPLVSMASFFFLSAMRPPGASLLLIFTSSRPCPARARIPPAEGRGLLVWRDAFSAVRSASLGG